MSPRPRARANRGFTLMELMIALTIVSILVGIAVPIYSDAQRKSRRGQAKADLVEAAQMMERYYSLNNKYSDSTLKDIYGYAQSPRTGAAHYALELSADAKSFKITATPSAASGQAKDKCGTLSLDSKGEKTASGVNCWD
ncbi:type IV pilin protein [Pseudomonas sp. CGJS7]|uniref:type IV pilin protein n=1 Tax=Pseudomonas sp. CGJS7 TaxID=3109348 RepID=UPI003008A7B3